MNIFLIFLLSSFVGDYIDINTQQLIHVHEFGLISLCKEVPYPWNQDFRYHVLNDTIYMNDTIYIYGILENATLTWKGGFSPYYGTSLLWEKVSDQVDYT
jgi:hypothetical protein